MKLTPPTFGVWLIALLLGGGGIAAKFGYVPVLAPHAFWLVVAGFGLLVAAVMVVILRWHVYNVRHYPKEMVQLRKIARLDQH